MVARDGLLLIILTGVHMSRIQFETDPTRCLVIRVSQLAGTLQSVLNLYGLVRIVVGGRIDAHQQLPARRVFSVSISIPSSSSR